MSNYEDFDLDLKEVKKTELDIKPDTAIYPSMSVCSIPCITTGCTNGCTERCSNDCPVPSRDYAHRSCRGPLNDGTVQINC